MSPTGRPIPAVAAFPWRSALGALLAAFALTACGPGAGAAAPAAPAPALGPTDSNSPTPDPAPPSPTAELPAQLPLAPPTASEEPTPTAEAGTPVVLGTSVAGRPLQVFRFGDGDRQLLIAAGIHGGYEWNTIALADELILRLRDEPQRVPPEITLYLLRSVNPDGEARSNGYRGRANDNGVDLNRNWPTNWHPDWDRTYCWNYLPISAGPHPVSEPETAAVMAFILEHDFEGLISYHSAALGIFPGGSPPDPASQDLAQTLALVSGYRTPPLDYGCEYTGQFADWAVSQGIPAVDVELTNHYDTDFEINLRVLEAFLAWRP